MDLGLFCLKLFFDLINDLICVFMAGFFESRDQCIAPFLMPLGRSFQGHEVTGNATNQILGGACGSCIDTLIELCCKFFVALWAGHASQVFVYLVNNAHSITGAIITSKYGSEGLRFRVQGETTQYAELSCIGLDTEAGTEVHRFLHCPSYAMAESATGQPAEKCVESFFCAGEGCLLGVLQVK